MSASSSKGVSICIIKDGATGTSMAATAATKASPAVVSVADTSTLADGDLVTFAADSTGLESLDGKTFPIKLVTGGTTDFEVVGTDTTNDAGTFAAGTDMTLFVKGDMQCMCFSEFSFNKEQPDQISTGTYCNPQDSIASAATSAGTVSFGGYIDTADPGYKMLLDLEAGTSSVIVRITFPDNGYILVPISVDSITWDVPLEGALGFSGTGTMKENPRHLF